MRMQVRDLCGICGTEKRHDRRVAKVNVLVGVFREEFHGGFEGFRSFYATQGNCGEGSHAERIVVEQRQQNSGRNSFRLAKHLRPLGTDFRFEIAQQRNERGFRHGVVVFPRTDAQPPDSVKADEEIRLLRRGDQSGGSILAGRKRDMGAHADALVGVQEKPFELLV